MVCVIFIYLGQILAVFNDVLQFLTKVNPFLVNLPWGLSSMNYPKFAVCMPDFFFRWIHSTNHATHVEVSKTGFMKYFSIKVWDMNCQAMTLVPDICRFIIFVSGIGLTRKNRCICSWRSLKFTSTNPKPSIMTRDERKNTDPIMHVLFGIPDDAMRIWHHMAFPERCNYRLWLGKECSNRHTENQL